MDENRSPFPSICISELVLLLSALSRVFLHITHVALLTGKQPSSRLCFHGAQFGAYDQIVISCLV